MGKVILVVVLFIVFAVLLTKETVNEKVWSGLSRDRGKCQQIVQTLTRDGLIQKIERNGADTRVTVDERRWQAVDYDQKVSAGVAAYCVNAPDDGRHRAYVYGSLNGKILGSVSNGNWFSN